MSSAATSPHPAPPPARGITAKLLVVPAVVVVLLAGLYLFSGVVAPNYDTSILFGVIWFLIAGATLNRVAARYGLRTPVRATFLVTAVAVGGITAWTTLRDNEVNETVVTGAPRSEALQPAARDQGADATATPKPAPQGNVQVAQGSFSALAHNGSGTAAIVELPSGERKLTLTRFETDNGPDLRVYLAKGEATSGSVGDFEDLGKLKGNKGNQQYDVPKGVNVGQFDTVVIWCRAFSVGYAQAPLKRS